MLAVPLVDVAVGTTPVTVGDGVVATSRVSPGMEVAEGTGGVVGGGVVGGEVGGVTDGGVEGVSIMSSRAPLGPTTITWLSIK